MQTFRGRVAVITGAASGIGRGLALRCGREGMRVVLADIEEAALQAAAQEVAALGVPTLAVVTDVAQAADVEHLARQTLSTFGAVHLLCNNAGVGIVRNVWECTLADWEWVLGVNMWGVINGVRVFVPIMLAQNTEGHIVNTSSISGLLVGPGASGPYNVSKHGVVALSTTLYYELAQLGARIHVSVLLPGYVNTRIADAERNRPAALSNAPDVPFGAREAAILAAVRDGLAQGMSPDDAAAIVFGAIRAEQFYIFTHPETKEWVAGYVADMLAGRNPPPAG